MAGMLYLCATPIGNLGDMTPRVIETLQNVDVIAAEDTRNSIKLLSAFDIHTPMTSYHEYNKVEKADQLIVQMQAGKILRSLQMPERLLFPTPERFWCRNARRRELTLPVCRDRLRALRR